ncbi:Tyrosine-protein phosphatase pmp1 [Madurella mycetomatis]|uniref:protein-tyrosine-phosphatase n=1 Tax=Madurella mycetomatis TaxID=100816 RepID=A0A175VY35_9PEZI|nr:Tyrosine-protein phosphatase pmp1 [Madurella mycetomatis]
MPSAAARRLYEDQIPSFMSVYDVDSEIMDHANTVTIVNPKLVMEDGKVAENSQPDLGPGALPSESAHRHNDSTSTKMSESADSSPTTTVSCTDSSDLSDPSPSSSPDSPVNLGPLQTFAPTSFAGLSGMASLTVSDPNRERPMTSPAPRRPKNMKGLSIQPPFSSISSSLLSEPCSPSFIKPMIPPMKRKPSQLSLKTNSSDLLARTTLDIPSSPAVPPILQRRALKHSTSSPQMLSGLKSATFGPAGGSSGTASSIAEEDSPIRTQIANRAAYEIEPYHEVENNEDQKSPGYPDGPVAIYGDNVYLYLEPTAEEAARFDVVINVAREVTNPFKATAGSQQPSDTKEKPDDDSPIPDTAVTTASFATAFEYFPEDASAGTPTTPKAQPLKEPEYIHMPWDHNTDIAQDLMTLCETIDKRTKEGKKVLVHCQQGASRSASLIIAYGLYQNPELSVNDAYYAAQAKSRWISPNMRLMYCLQDFQKEVSKRRVVPSAGFKPRAGRSPTKHRATMSADNIETPPKEPLTAPLPTDSLMSKSASPERSPVRARGNSTPNRGEPISPGPSSAPSSFSWTEKEDESDPSKFGRFNLNPRLMPPQTDSGFASSVSSISKPLPSPGLAPPLLSKPPRSPGFAPLSISRPPPSPGLVPLEISRPPLSPGFPPPAPFSRPPPSPGFAAHRYGATEGGLGFGSLNLGSSPKPVERKEAAPERHVTVMRNFPDDAALLSPRAETMTNNPIHESFNGFPGMQFIEVPPTPNEGLFSPRETMFPRDPFLPFGRPIQTADPRSPPTKGETPIVRSIDEMI